jgi:hypothetical protein
LLNQRKGEKPVSVVPIRNSARGNATVTLIIQKAKNSIEKTRFLFYNEHINFKDVVL